MHPEFHRSSSRNGSALLLVLWSLLVIGMAVFGVVDMVELSVEHTSHAEREADAHALAMSGVALGLNPQLLKDDPLFSQKLAEGRGFQVEIESEGARLNLNYVLLSGHREILVNLFTQWGLSIADADHAADCLYDWITPGDLKSLNGAKASDYAAANLPQRPTYQPFVSFSEVGEVMGMDAVQKARSNWQDSFTLWSGGPLNVNEAPASLIAAVFSLDPSRVANFTEVRDGRDGVAGTTDDVPVPSMTVFAAELGLDDLVVKALGGQVSLSDSHRRIQSTGSVNGATSVVSVVTALNSSPPQYLLWSEH